MVLRQSEMYLIPAHTRNTRCPAILGISMIHWARSGISGYELADRNASHITSPAAMRSRVESVLVARNARYEAEAMKAVMPAIVSCNG